MTFRDSLHEAAPPPHPENDINKLPGSPSYGSGRSDGSTSPSIELGEEDYVHVEVERDTDRGLRWAMIALACCLSIGSHFGSFLLGPLKKSLHSSEAAFSSLISSLQLVSTISPIFVSSLVPRFGAATVGLVATAMVASGMAIVTYARGDGDDPQVGMMVFGLAIFGCGTAPIAIAQESLLFSVKSDSSKSIGRSMAMGLILGKTSSFVAAYSAAPLGAIYPRLPFETALFLSLFSFCCCLLYGHLEVRASRNRIAGSGGKTTNGTPAHGERKMVGLWEPSSYGDPFWLYVLVCALAGIWFSTIHLSSSLLQTIYDTTQAEASKTASLILLSSTALYFPLGWLLDTKPHVLSSLYIAVSVCLATSFTVLYFFHDFVPMIIAILPAAVGIGSGPLLLVMVVPRIVERQRVATALGIHKSAEMSGAIIFQAVSSWLLSSSSTPLSGSYSVIFFFLLLTLTKLSVILYWWRLMRLRDFQVKFAATEYSMVGDGLTSSGEEGGESSLAAERRSLSSPDQSRILSPDLRAVPPPILGSRNHRETARGRKATVAALGLVGTAWLFFLINLMRR